MEQDKKEESSTALDVYLHPLVVINISDHFTRVRANSNSKNSGETRVIGCLYGTQEGRRVEVRTSFEMVYGVEDGRIIINAEYVFPKYEVLGWYSTGDQKLPTDDAIHEQVTLFNDNPLYLLVGVNIKKDMKDIPLTLYEPTVTIENKRQLILWASIPYKIETDEAERIGVDFVNKMERGTTQSSTLVPHFATLYNAVHMLTERIQIITRYLELVKNGTIPVDHKLLRQISSLSHRLPAVDSSKFKSDYNNELNESLLITYMASMTKGTNVLNEVVEKFNVTYERRGRRLY
ncbi:csn6 [Acrasis kona]|uniref:COP9 signalosome complex subunit 6 n=1 Tax=Acrasis kona TaxID=1008807 RepID=A0AAW2ZCH7_9EUKA